MPSAKQIMVLPVDSCTKLDLSNRDLKTHDLKTLNITRFNLLEQLDLSNNTLDSFPEEMKLHSLRTLNFSENRFRCVKFLKQFPNLEEVSAEMNLININDEYMAIHMLPKLQLFNGHSTTHLRNTISQYETKLSERLKKIWKEKYNEKFLRVSSLLESNRIEKSLRRELQVVSCGPASLQHFKDYLIAHIVKGHMSKATQQKLNKNCPDDTDRAAGEPPKKRQKLNKVNGIKEKQKASKKLKLKGDGLKYDYSPVHFLRCHSKNNDQVDANTKVWRCLFEPNPEHPDESSDTVATCGGEAICLIDCKSGKVMKKYKQPNEDFYAIAWTSVHIEIGGKKQAANLLAAGGKNGELRLIYPSQLRCYSSTSHRGPINALLFHPLNATQLFSGTHEVIILWDIGIPKLPNYECHPRQLCKFEAVSSVLNLIVLPNLGRLIGACEDGIYGWDLDVNAGTKKRTITKEYLLPSCKPKEQVFVDGLISIQDDIIATKFCRETEEAFESDDRIHVWSVKETERQLRKQETDFEILPVKVSHTLEWKHIGEIYLYLGNRKDSGVLASGDDQGNIHLYDVSKVNSSNANSTVASSKVLCWPGLDGSAESILIDDVDISSDLKTIVAVTHNNIVCIWKAT